MNRFLSARKYFILAVLLIFITGLTFAQAKVSTFKAQSPVLITSFGQSQDATLVDILGKRVNLPRSYQFTIFAENIEWNKYKTIIYVIGGSGKGLGSAGLDIQDEVKRSKAIIAEAKKRKTKLIAMHIGGEDRRGSNSTPFLDFCLDADLMVVREDGNKDGYFTNASKKSGVPLLLLKTTMEIQDFLKLTFDL